MLLLIVVVVALVILLPELGFCPRLDVTGVNCTGGVSQTLAEFALGTLVFSIFTGIPFVLALIGAVILLIRLFRKWRKG